MDSVLELARRLMQSSPNWTLTWLTVLTSMFALIMDAWPTEAMRPGANAPDHHASPPPSRPSLSAASVAPN